ncbi:DUF2247 family protein [Paludibaculum fermentans]|uniref:DUF2247 family protein n=1 Tax=Paludibaculum fermentans TaxID=1473598 RepID=UPI003EB774AB
MENPLSLSSVSGLLPIPVELSRSIVPLTWPEIVWAYEMGILGWRGLAECAKARLDSVLDDKVLMDLAYLTKQDSGSAGDLARCLADRSGPVNESIAKQKWMYILLRWLHEHRSEFPNILDIIELIYADFGYPDEIQGLVNWMPASEPVLPGEPFGTRAERLWREYLEKAGALLEEEGTA